MKLQWITFYFRRNKKAAEFNDIAIVAGILCGVPLILGELFSSQFFKLLTLALSLLWLGCMVTAFHYSRHSKDSI